ncbi:MAG TPA: FAD-binding oxidoreductase, partial [Pirellula sp.]|nr:FAD-binding oxidoreductase [Pirellula sp.]
MNSRLEQTTSVWMQLGVISSPASLSKDVGTDVCVVGAGISGMTTAYLLLREGKSVVVLDDGPIGGGQTQRTTAHLTNAIDDRYIHIEDWHGYEGMRMAAESHTAAIDRIEAIVNEEKIECEFERLDGYLVGSSSESLEILQQELQAARRAGLSQIELIPHCPLREFNTVPCLRFPRQGQFHPLKYLTGLKQAVQRMGGLIITQTRVEKIESGPPAIIHTYLGPTVTAHSVVVATNSPFNDFVTIHTKQAANISYVLGFEVPKGSVTKALYWDLESPYHYVRLQPLSESESSGELLIVGGEDHKTGQANDADDRYGRIEEWTRKRFPASGKILYRWSGQVLETIDGLAFIGRNPLDGQNVYIATGDSGQGMTHGTIAGILLTDLILERENPWSTLYDPSRKTIRAAGRYLKENLNVAAQYTTWMTGGDVGSTQSIALGTGA